MLTQNQILKYLYEHYAIVFPPVELKEVPKASIHLVKAGLPKIPSDYATFLSATNGLSWNGISFFSLNNIEREKGAFSHPGILQNYAFCQNNALMQRKLLLGWGLESLFVYDASDKKYQILDRYSYQVIDSFETFKEVLYSLIEPLLHK